MNCHLNACFAPNTFKCELESLLTLDHSNCWRDYEMSFLQLALLFDKTIAGINSILESVSISTNNATQ